MDDERDLDAWADRFLDQHRTPAEPEPEPQVSVDDLPPGARFMIRLSGQKPDPHTVARLHRSGRRFAGLARLDAIMSVIATVGVVVAVVVLFGVASG